MLRLDSDPHLGAWKVDVKEQDCWKKTKKNLVYSSDLSRLKIQENLVYSSDLSRLNNTGKYYDAILNWKPLRQSQIIFYLYIQSS